MIHAEAIDDAVAAGDADTLDVHVDLGFHIGLPGGPDRDDGVLNTLTWPGS